MPSARQMVPMARNSKDNNINNFITAILCLCIFTMAILLIWGVAQGETMVWVIAAIGIGVVIVVGAGASGAPDSVRSQATERTLRTASLTLEHLRGGLTFEGCRAVCQSLLPETVAIAVAITDHEKVIAYVGESEENFPPGRPISTQATLMISELRDGIVIMKDGSFRAVVACQSINFDLMSEQEREGVEYSYQNFLNSLNFTIQILVRSQRVDIGPYIEKLAKIRRNNDNMLLGILMDDYIAFIDELAREANIMDKSFFIVIPYYPSADLERAVEETKNFFKVVNKNKNQGVTRINRDVYDKAVDELNNRVESVISGLFQIGIQSIRLRTRELSQLFYNFDNPDTAVREPLVDFSQMATTYVRKGTK